MNDAWGNGIVALSSAILGAGVGGFITWIDVVHRRRLTLAQEGWAWAMEFHRAVADLVTARATLARAPASLQESEVYLDIQRRLMLEIDAASTSVFFPTVYMALRTEYGRGPRRTGGSILQEFEAYLKLMDELLALAQQVTDFQVDGSSREFNDATLSKVVPRREKFMDLLVNHTALYRIVWDQVWRN